jgi:hypothetical protein
VTRHVIFAVLVLGIPSGCTFEISSVELPDAEGQQQDLTVPSPDLTGADLAGADLTAVPNDLAMGPPDLSMPADLAMTPMDLTTPPDLTQVVGVLTLAANTGTPDVDLTAEGTLDWTHYGLTVGSAVNRRSGPSVTPMIQATATDPVFSFGSFASRFSWSDGTPTAAINNTRDGAYMGSGIGNGWTFTIPASTTQRELRLYVLIFQSQGTITASLGDGSAPMQTQDLAPPAGQQSQHARYTIIYRAATATTLTVTWKMSQDTGNDGTIDLLAATLK